MRKAECNKVPGAPPAGDRLIDAEEHRLITGLCKTAQVARTNSGEFKRVILGPRCVRYSEREAREWVARQVRESGDSAADPRRAAALDFAMRAAKASVLARAARRAELPEEAA